MTNKVRINGKLRSTKTGHRVTDGGVEPKETRSQPVRTWPGELRDRRKARKAGRK